MSKTSKRHFTVVIQNKEHGLYISSTPSSAAKKAVSKLCASNKKKKVEFHIREITRDSKKKTYGPYIGYLEKLKIPIKLKEYIIKYNPVAKLKKKSTVKKVGMKGGTKEIFKNYRGNYYLMRPKIEIETEEKEDLFKKIDMVRLVFDKEKYIQEMRTMVEMTELTSVLFDIRKSQPCRLKNILEFLFRNDITDDILQKFLEEQRPKIIKIFHDLEIQYDIKIYINVPYVDDHNPESEPIYHRIEYLEYKPDKMLKYLNIALKSIGIDKCLILFSRFLESFPNTLPIISVGSGNAYFEFLISHMHKREITCVDPTPRSFRINARTNSHHTVFIEPKFSTVDQLISSNNHNQYKNCLLILNWPNPQNKNGQIMYDFDAIIKLKPNGFFIIFDSNGLSGSNKMIQLLRSIKNTINFNTELSYKLLEKEEHYQRINQYGIENCYEFVVAFYRRTEP